MSDVKTAVSEAVTNALIHGYDGKVKKIMIRCWIEGQTLYVETVSYTHLDVYKRQLYTLKTVLGDALKLLHPFMPFVTEEIYGALVPEEESLMMSSWPEYKESSCYPEAENIV